MSKIVCESCDELFDVCAGVISLPFVCGSCEKDAALAIDASEGSFIVECRAKYGSYLEWFRSGNPNTNGVFDDYSTALEAAESEQDGSSIEYRVVPFVPYNSGVPCQSAFDSVQAGQYLDPYGVGETDPRVHAMHTGDVLDQFDADTELIDGLMAEIEDLKAQLEYREAAIEILKNALVNIFNDAAVAMSR
jgi:hypothetical protein